MLGQGKYTCVSTSDDDATIAIKFIENRRDPTSKTYKIARSSLKCELGILTTLVRNVEKLRERDGEAYYCPLVVRLTGHYYHRDSHGKHLTLCLTAGPKTTLQQYVKRGQVVQLWEGLHLMGQLLMATLFLHDHGVSHRDIRPHNVLWDGEQLMLIDLGDACLIDGLDAQTCAEPYPSCYRGYTPVEYYKQEFVVPAMGDVWNVAATILFSLTGVEPHEKLRRIMDPADYVTARLLGPEVQVNVLQVPPPMSTLLSIMLRDDPSRRPTILQAYDELASSYHPRRTYFECAQINGSGNMYSIISVQ